MTLEDIVSNYIREYRDDALKDMRFFEILRSPSAAMCKAALCELPSGKHHPHQRRIPEVLLEQVEARLQGIGRKLAKAADFAALHRLVEKEIAGIKGIGALTVYDIAHRIGAHFRKPPQRVYLHAGTRIGARVFDIHGESFDPRQLPKAFSRQAPSEIEDCLCIYKDELRCVPRHSRRNSKRLSESGHAGVGSDFGALFLNSIRYIVGVLNRCGGRLVDYSWS